MSIKRYDIRGWDFWFDESPDGDHVLYEDHVAEVERLRAALRSLYDGACDAWNRMAGYGAVDPELVLPLLAGPLDKAKRALEVPE